MPSEVGKRKKRKLNCQVISSDLLCKVGRCDAADGEVGVPARPVAAWCCTLLGIGLVEVGEYHLLQICCVGVFSWILSLFVSKGVKLHVTRCVTVGFSSFPSIGVFRLTHKCTLTCSTWK